MKRVVSGEIDIKGPLYRDDDLLPVGQKSQHGYTRLNTVTARFDVIIATQD